MAQLCDVHVCESLRVSLHVSVAQGQGSGTEALLQQSLAKFKQIRLTVNGNAELARDVHIELLVIPKQVVWTCILWPDSCAARWAGKK